MATAAATIVVEFDCAVQAKSFGSPKLLTSRISGVRTRVARGERDRHLHGVEVVLEPWAAFSLFGQPMDKLTNTEVAAADLFGEREGELVDELASAEDWEQCFNSLDAVLSQWQAVRPCSYQVQLAWYLLCRTSGTIPISELVSETGWSQRQLERRFREQIGLPPKAAARVLRFERARRLLAVDRPLAEVATACGYYDQAHLSREFTALAGSSISRFRRERASVDDKVVEQVLSIGREMTILSKTDSGPGGKLSSVTVQNGYRCRLL